MAISQETIDQVIDALANTTKIYEVIAAEVGISSTSVGRICRERDMQGRAHDQKIRVSIPGRKKAQPVVEELVATSVPAINVTRVTNTTNSGSGNWNHRGVYDDETSMYDDQGNIIDKKVFAQQTLENIAKHDAEQELGLSLAWQKNDHGGWVQMHGRRHETVAPWK